MSISAAAAAVLVRGKLLLRRNMSMGMVIRSWLACVRNVKFMIAAVSCWACRAVSAANCRTLTLKISLSS